MRCNLCVHFSHNIYLQYLCVASCMLVFELYFSKLNFCMSEYKKYYSAARCVYSWLQLLITTLSDWKGSKNWIKTFLQHYSVICIIFIIIYYFYNNFYNNIFLYQSLINPVRHTTQMVKFSSFNTWNIERFTVSLSFQHYYTHQ